MPRRQRPKKDVYHCEKLRGVVVKLRSVDIRMGKPILGNARIAGGESIAIERGTRGTETSKYPEEKKRFRK
jgi:hypothetical protein